MSLIEGIFAADAQGQANKLNRKNAKETNAQNLWLAMIANGAPIPSDIGGIKMPPELVGRSASILPYYFADQERAMASDAGAAYREAFGNAGPEAIAQLYRSRAEAFRPQVEAAGRTAAGIFDDSITGELLGNQAPVAEERLAAAGAEKNSQMEALSATLNEIKATQAKRGFTGDSGAENALRFEARRRIGSDSARAVSAAKLANAGDVRAIKDAGINRKLGSLSLPFQMARSTAGFEDIPAEAVNQRFALATNPVFQFRNRPNFAQMQRPPQESAILNPGAYGAREVGNAGRDLANFFIKRNEAAQLRKQQQDDALKTSPVSSGEPVR